MKPRTLLIVVLAVAALAVAGYLYFRANAATVKSKSDPLSKLLTGAFGGTKASVETGDFSISFGVK
jgi:hypothetical protein